jgi:gas vesicle protein
MSNNSGLSVLGVIAGVAVGAGVGILFAPDKGSQTRQKIKLGYDDVKDDLKQKFEETADTLKEKLMSKKFNLEDSYDSLVSNLENRKEDVVGFLENKLTELKKTRVANTNIHTNPNPNARI